VSVIDPAPQLQLAEDPMRDSTWKTWLSNLRDKVHTLNPSNNAIVIPIIQTPASASATGVKGTITWDASYIYVCVSSNTWKRIGISTW